MAVRALENPEDPVLGRLHDALLVDVDRFVAERLAGSPAPPPCRAGCAACCDHHVGDVAAFEVRRILETVERFGAADRAAILTRAGEDVALYRRISATVPSTEEGLGRFHAAHRPCPLLAEDRRCRVWPVRPLTCRLFHAWSDPALCAADHPDHATAATFLVGLGPDAEAAWELLHRVSGGEGEPGFLREALLSSASRGSSAG